MAVTQKNQHKKKCQARAGRLYWFCMWQLWDCCWNSVLPRRMLERGDSKKEHKKGSRMRKRFIELSYSGNPCLYSLTLVWERVRDLTIFLDGYLHVKKCCFASYFYRHEFMGKREEENFNRVAICYQHCLGLFICCFSDTGATPTHLPFLPEKMVQLLQPGSSILQTADYQDSAARSWTLPDKVRLEIGQNFPEIR